MKRQEFIIDCYGRVIEVLEEALNGLTEDDLNQQPHQDCNSIGWLTWHLTRVQDHHIASLSGEEQLWVKEGWYTKFNQTPNARDTGYHHTSEDVSGFKSPDVETQLAYHRAVLEQTKRYINTLSASDLDREVSEPWFQSLPTVGGGLICALDDNLQHAGQVAYLRGLLKGKGWYEI